MSRRVLIVAASVLIAGAAAYFIFNPPPQDLDAKPPAADAALNPRRPAPRTASIPAAVSAAARDHAAEFHASDDLLAFARRMHVLAQAGDPVAMYYIHAASRRCESYYSLYFKDHAGKLRTLEEALQYEDSARASDLEEVRSLYRQCRRWTESPPADLGSLNGWLEQSANAGYPPAQANWAGHLLTYRGNHENPTDAERARARELALRALRSRDPEAYYDAEYAIGWFKTLPPLEERDPEGGDDEGSHFVESEARRIETKAWWYAACFRGVDCGPQSGLVRVQCSHDPACQPYEDYLDLLRRGPDANIAGEIERRAREISDLIDAGRWSDLGIRD